MVDLAPLDLIKMDFSHDYKKVKDRQKAYQLVKSTLTADFIAKYKIDVNFDYQEDRKIDAKGTGFSLQIDFKESCCEIDLHLAFPFNFLKPKILGSIKKEIGRII